MKYSRGSNRLFILLCFSAPLFAGDCALSEFGLSNWVAESFAGNTQYRLLHEENETVLYAKAEGTASALYCKQQVNLDQTPYIKWRWKTNAVGLGNNEHSKQGDDYPLRLYVIVSGGLRIWSNYALVYVWSNSAAPGQSWENPYAQKVKHIAVESGADNLGQWRQYQRNLKRDFQRLFGFVPKKIDALAVMTDTDNTNQVFESWYSNIEFIRN